MDRSFVITAVVVLAAALFVGNLGGKISGEQTKIVSTGKGIPSYAAIKVGQTAIMPDATGAPPTMTVSFVSADEDQRQLNFMTPYGSKSFVYDPGKGNFFGDNEVELVFGGKSVRAVYNDMRDTLYLVDYLNQHYITGGGNVIVFTKSNSCQYLGCNVFLPGVWLVTKIDTTQRIVEIRNLHNNYGKEFVYDLNGWIEFLDGGQGYKARVIVPIFGAPYIELLDEKFNAGISVFY